MKNLFAEKMLNYFFYRPSRLWIVLDLSIFATYLYLLACNLILCNTLYIKKWRMWLYGTLCWKVI